MKEINPKERFWVALCFFLAVIGITIILSLALLIDYSLTISQKDPEISDRQGCTCYWTRRLTPNEVTCPNNWRGVLSHQSAAPAKLNCKGLSLCRILDENNKLKYIPCLLCPQGYGHESLVYDSIDCVNPFDLSIQED